MAGTHGEDDIMDVERALAQSEVHDRQSEVEELKRQLELREKELEELRRRAQTLCSQDKEGREAKESSTIPVLRCLGQ